MEDILKYITKVLFMFKVISGETKRVTTASITTLFALSNLDGWSFWITLVMALITGVTYIRTMNCVATTLVEPCDVIRGTGRVFIYTATTVLFMYLALVGILYLFSI